ncbi:MAG: hypothetical protein GXW99_00150 [Clostridiales bacterium]|nr:hypothetical protein [Clostridiales bacterium]
MLCKKSEKFFCSLSDASYGPGDVCNINSGFLRISQIFHSVYNAMLVYIFSATKIDMLEKDLAGLKICYELTPDMLKATHFCTKCNFLMGENEVPVKGKLDAFLAAHGGRNGLPALKPLAQIIQRKL